MATSCNFKNSKDSTKAWFITNDIIDKFYNILDLKKFRIENSRHTNVAKAKLGVDEGRIYGETNNGTKAIPNENAFNAIDNAKRTGYPDRDSNENFQLVNNQIQATNQQLSEVEDRIKKFLDSIGFTYNPSTIIHDRNGNPIDAVAKVDLINRIVHVVEGKRDVSTLPEEAAHILVEMIEQTNTSLFDELMKGVENKPVYGGVIDKYSTLYNGDVNKLKKEAVGKLISQSFLDMNGITPDVGLVKRILNFLRDLFSKAKTDPYAQVSRLLMLESANDLNFELGKDTEFYQLEDQENILRQMDADAENLELRELDVTTLPKRAYKGHEPTVTLYWDKKLNKVVARRASTASEEGFVKKMGVEKARQITNRADVVAQRNVGIRLHSVMSSLFNHIINGTGKYSDIMEASELNASQFKVLVDTANAMVNDMLELQKKIDSEGKVVIRSEQILHDRLRDVAGTTDFLAIFSNGKAAVYDFKFISYNKYNSKREEYTDEEKLILIDEAVGIDKEETYEIQLGVYKNTLKTYGVSEVIRSRVVPFMVELDIDETSHQKVDHVATIESSYGKTKGFLHEVPVGQEPVPYKRINESIKKLMDIRTKLIGNLKGLPSDERKDAVRHQIATLSKSIRDIQLKNDVNGIMNDIYNFSQQFSKKNIKSIDNNEPTVDGKKNLSYFTNQELVDASSILEVYLDMLGNLDEYIEGYDDATKEQKAYISRLLENSKELGSELNGIRVTISNKINERAIDAASKQGIDIEGEKVAEGTLMGNLFNSISQIPHPIFKSFWSFVKDAESNTRKQLVDIYTRIQDHVKELEDWGKRNGKKGLEIYDPFINNETGNLIHIYQEDIIAQTRKHKLDRDDVWLKKYWSVKPEYLEEKFASNQEKMFSIIERKLPINSKNKNLNDENKRLREQQKKDWLRVNDPKNKEFWLSDRNMGNVEIRPELREKYYSDEYKAIRADETLSKFYDFLIETNKEFSRLVGPGLIWEGSFIANIRKTSIEATNLKGYSPIQSLMDSLSISQDGVIENQNIRDGQAEHEIPLLYTNPLYDSEGNIDIGAKSRDLGKSLFLFAKSAYNYSNKKEIEGAVMALRSTLESNPGIEVLTDTEGKPKMNRVHRLAVKLGIGSYLELFDRFNNYYMYGEKIQGKDKTINLFGHELSMKKTVKKLMQYKSARVLSFAVLAPAAAYISGSMNTFFEAVKNVHFDRHDLNEMAVRLAKQDKLLKALSGYWAPYQEDMSYRMANDLSATKAGRWLNTEMMYRGFSWIDERLDDLVMSCMMKNYGIDSDGNIVNIKTTKNPPKSLLESARIENDRIVIDGIDEKSYESFRQKVKEVGGSIKGQMSNEDIMVINTYLGGQMLMQFKSWMPRLLQERLSGARYNNTLGIMQQGRYSVAAQELFVGNEELKGLGLGVARNALKITAMIFGFKKMQADPDIAEFQYRKFKEKNINNSKLNKITFDEFFQMREAQINAMITETRMGMAFFAAIMLGGKLDLDDDDTKDYKEFWATRRIFQLANRAFSELGVAWNPAGLTQWLGNPIPVSSTITDFIKLVLNGFDSARDIILGQDDKGDKTPPTYYLSDWLLLDKVLAWFEIYDQDKVKK